MLKDVIKMGDPKLSQRSLEIEEYEFNTPELNALIVDMTDTMRHLGGVGIAAVQIGVLKRIALIEYDNSNTRYANIGSQSLTVVINPELVMYGTELLERDEGCLSVPTVRGVTSRAKALRYKFFDQYGKLVEGISDDFFARVLQHETDHMNGILYPERIPNLKTLRLVNLK